MNGNDAFVAMASYARKHSFNHVIVDGDWIRFGGRVVSSQLSVVLANEKAVYPITAAWFFVVHSHLPHYAYLEKCRESGMDYVCVALWGCFE